jgi:hypothetical protein
VYNGRREHIFWLLVSWQVREIISWAWFSAKFLIERALSCLYLHYRTLAGSWPVKLWSVWSVEVKNWGPWIFSTSAWNSWSIPSIPSCRILEFRDFGWVREEAKGADDHKSQIQNNTCAKTFPTSPHMSNLIAETQVMLEKAYFSWWGS